jgi:integrase
MRLGECLGLEPEDIHQAAQQVRVARAILDGEVTTPKSGHGRTIDISVKLAEVLSRWDLERKTEKLRRGWAEMPRWLFYSDAGTPLDDSNVRKVMARVLKRVTRTFHPALPPPYLRLADVAAGRVTGVRPAAIGPREHSTDGRYVREVVADGE